MSTENQHESFSETQLSHIEPHSGGAEQKHLLALRRSGEQRPDLTPHLSDSLSVVSDQKRLQESVELLRRFKQGTLPPGVTDAQVNSASETLW